MTIDPSQALAAPEVDVQQRQRKPRASDPKKTLAMILRRWKSPEVQKKVRLAKLIEDAFDQMPPDGDEELEADGLGWCANVDWGGMSAGVADGVEIDYNLATQPDTYIRLVARDPKKALSDAMSKLERLDKEMLDGWTEWDTELQQMLHNRRALGLGIFHFPHPHGWHFRNLHPCNLVLPERAKLNPATWPWCAIRTELQITDLLARFNDRQAATKVGWKLIEITKAISKYAKNGGSALVGKLYTDPEGYIFDLAHNDLSFASENNMTIPGWTFYVKEFDNSVSEYILTDDEEIGWLYMGEKRHKDIGELISLFPLSLGQGYIERIRGYGVKMLPFHDLENRVLNHACDVTMLGSGLILQGTNGDDFTRMREEVRIHGPIAFLPEGITPQQQSFGNPSAGVLALRQEFEKLGHMRNRAFGGAEYGQREADESATGARLRWQERNTARTYEIARFYRQLTTFHSNRWKKMADPGLTKRDRGGPEVKALLKDAAQQGVVAADIKSIKKVVARTIFGDGDPNNQFLALADLEKHMARLPVSGQKHMLKMIFQARLRDSELVSDLFGPEDPAEDRDFMRQRWRCQVENNTFETSDTRQDIQDDDNHLIHSGEHIVYAEDVIGRVDEGHLPEVEALTRVLRCKPHLMAHLPFVQANPLLQAEFKDIMRRWADIENRLRQMSQHVQAEQAKEQTRQLEELKNPTMSVKDREIMLTEQAKREAIAAEAQLSMQLKSERHQKELEILASSKTLKDSLDILNAANADGQ